MLAAEGFIHCSNADQALRIANLFYSDLPELLILCIETALGRSPIKDEMVGTAFSSRLRASDRDAVSEVRPMLRGLEHGRWTFTE